MKLRVALYGGNGHQIQAQLVNHPGAGLVAFAGIDRSLLPIALRDDARIRELDSLDALLEDSQIDLISFCSPRRIDQAKEAVRALEAGKHVYAEKPCAMTEADLDQITETARRTGKLFHEMAGTAFGQPYLAMRQAVQSGAIGEIVQVLAQKSYPYIESRPQDEAIDGGLIGQNAIHALRMIEHVAGCRILTIRAVETSHGNPVPAGGLRMAASMIMTLQGGGVGAVIANYLNQRQGDWGNEFLRIFGTRGNVESTENGHKTRLVVNHTDLGPLDTSAPGLDYFDAFVAEIRSGQPMPLTLDEELHPTRMTILAKRIAI